MIDTFYDGFALRNQPSDNQAGRGAQVGGHDDCAIQAGNAAHQCGIAIHFDIRAKAAQLLHMHETIFKYRFCHPRRAIGNRVQHHELCLHVGGESRIGRSAYVHRFDRRVHLQIDPVWPALDYSASLTQFIQYTIKNIGAHICKLD